MTVSLGLSPSRVYVAADQNGWHKIGMTRNPKLRAYHLARDRRLQVTMVEVFPERIDANRVEVTAHWLLADHENLREWFNVTAAQAVAAVNQAIAMVDGGHIPHSRFSYLRRKVSSVEQDARVRAALFKGENMKHFFDRAIEAELKRREAVKQ